MEKDIVEKKNVEMSSDSCIFRRVRGAQGEDSCRRYLESYFQVIVARSSTRTDPWANEMNSQDIDIHVCAETIRPDSRNSRNADDSYRQTRLIPTGIAGQQRGDNIMDRMGATADGCSNPVCDDGDVLHLSSCISLLKKAVIQLQRWRHKILQRCPHTTKILNPGS